MRMPKEICTPLLATLLKTSKNKLDKKNISDKAIQTESINTATATSANKSVPRDGGHWCCE